MAQGGRNNSRCANQANGSPSAMRLELGVAWGARKGDYVSDVRHAS
jgi:hypothetical protein